MSIMDRIKVHLLHPCYECHEYFGSSSAVLKHLKSVHGIEIDPGQPSQKRPPSKAYVYQNDYTDDCATHFACPSCWYHCSEDFDLFSRHVIEAHVYPAANKGVKNGKKVVSIEGSVKSNVIEEPERIYKNKGKIPITTISTVDGSSQEALKEKEDEILNVLNELVSTFKQLFNRRSKVN